MKTKFIRYFSFLLFAVPTSISAQQNQYMKWMATLRATHGIAPGISYYTAQAGIGANAAMFHKGDVFDSSPYYLEMSATIDAPTQLYSGARIQGAHASVGFKNFLYRGHSKERPFGTFGGGMSVYKVKQNLQREQSFWNSLDLDYFLYAGLGYTLAPSVEVFGNYAVSLNRAMPSPAGSDLRRNTVTAGINFYFYNNYWFSSPNQRSRPWPFRFK